MRVLLLTHLYLPTVGGVQRSVHNLASHLVGRGHEVSIATHRPGRFGGISITKEEPAPVLGMNVASPFTFHPFRTVRRYALDVVNLTALSAWCAARRVQVVHCHLINVDTRYAFAAARASGAKVVVTLRGGETEHWLDAHPRRVGYVRRVLERADYVTAVSAALLRQACDLVPAVGQKSCVIGNPVAVQELEALARAAASSTSGASGTLSTSGTSGMAGTSRRRPFVLFVGRLEQMKDVAVLLEAFDIASADRSFGHDLVIVGTGSLESALRERARRSPNHERISFAGDCDHTAALRLIAAAAVLVLPSRSSEGCPNVALEAMALGTSLVVSDLESLAELVGAGTAGAVFPRGDARALAARIVDVSGDHVVRERYIRAARELVASRHDVGYVIEQYERVYDRLVGASSASMSSS